MFFPPTDKRNYRSTRHIALHLHNGGRIVMYTKCPEVKLPFYDLGKLLCAKVENWKPGIFDLEFTTVPMLPEGRHTLWKTALTEIAYAEDWSHILIAGWKRPPRNKHDYKNQIWQMGLIFAGMNAIIHGQNAVLVHGAALETERGAVVLFGESGMGKSTASARWRAHGGKCISDDMVLLDFSGGEKIYVRRMPTWSACREGKNEWNYPADEELPLIGVLALGRNESGTGGDEVVELSAAQFYAQCYRSMFYWNLFYAGKLPEEKQKRLGDRIRELTNIVTGKYPPRALLTVLKGNPIPVIESYLENLEAR